MPTNNNVGGGLFTKTDDATNNSEIDKMSKELHEVLEVLESRGNADLQGTSDIMAQTVRATAALDDTLSAVIKSQEARGVVTPGPEKAKTLVQSITGAPTAEPEKENTFKP